MEEEKKHLNQLSKGTIVMKEGPNLTKGAKRATKEAARSYIRKVLIIHILSDGKKHDQTEILKSFNKILDKSKFEKGHLIQGYDEIFGEYHPLQPSLSRIAGSWALSLSGKMEPSAVTRIVRVLENDGIVNRKSGKRSRGINPCYNWLNPTLNSFLNIFELLNSFPHPWNEGIFFPFSQTLLNSPYGKQVINFETIKKELESIAGGKIEDEDIKFVLDILKISPSALYGLLKFRRNYPRVKGNENLLIKTIGKFVSSMGNDIWRDEFKPTIPFSYSIKINLNKQSESKLIIDNDNLDLCLNFGEKM